MPAWLHALCRLLRHQKAAEGRDLDGPVHLFRVEIEEGPAHTAAGVVDDDFRRAAQRLIHMREEPRDRLDIGGIAGEGGGSRLQRKLAELVDVAGGEPDLDAILRQQAGERGAEPIARADDECALVIGHHGSP